MIKLSTKNFRFKNGYKLAPHYIPVKITAKISNQVYKVRLSEKYYYIYNVVPVLFLKPWTAPHDLEKAPLPDLKNNQEVSRCGAARHGSGIVRIFREKYLKPLFGNIS